MSVASVSFIHGLSLGLEFVEASPEDDIPDSMIILDFFILRFIFKIG